MADNRLREEDVRPAAGRAFDWDLAFLTGWEGPLMVVARVRFAAHLHCRRVAREMTPAAMQALEDVVTSDRAPPAARVAAATVILDRGWGKPQQDVSVTQTFDVADRIIARWKENLARLNAE